MFNFAVNIENRKTKHKYVISTFLLGKFLKKTFFLR